MVEPGATGSATGGGGTGRPARNVRILAGCSGVAVAALVVCALVFVAPASQRAFRVVGGLEAHDCPGGPAVAEIPVTDVIVLTGWRYEGRFGHWRAVTWDDSRTSSPRTRLLWVTDDDLRRTLGDATSRDNGKLLTDPAFDTCVPTQPTVLGTAETRVPDTEARSAVVTDSPDTGSPGTSVTPTPAVTQPVATTAGKKVVASTAKPQPATATTPTAPTTVSTTTSSSSTTVKPAATTNTTSPTLHMPDVLGLPHQDAAQQLTDLGLHVTQLVVDLAKGDSRDGLVVSQLPAAGTSVDPGTTVFIGVGNVPKVVVPNVVGVYWEEAQNTLTAAGFDVHTVLDPQLSPDGNVLSQDPVGGTQAPAGSTVTITINDVCC